MRKVYREQRDSMNFYRSFKFSLFSYCCGRLVNICVNISLTLFVAVMKMIIKNVENVRILNEKKNFKSKENVKTSFLRMNIDEMKGIDQGSNQNKDFDHMLFFLMLFSDIY
jgi:hypothetical protein